MKTRLLCNKKVSEVGLGTWQLGSADWGNVTEEKAFEILTKFVKKGGNFIDTADVYGSGLSEKYIGKFIKETKADVLVATKLGRRTDKEYGWPENFTYDSMLDHVEDSLKRLGMSSIFLEQLHCVPKDELYRGVVFDHLRRLQDEGYIENWGASVENIEEALVCLDEEGISTLQVIFNIFRQNVADELFEKAAAKNVGIIVRVPLASGLLSGKFDESSTFGFYDHRNYNAEGEYFNVGETFSGLPFYDGVKLVDGLRGMLPQGNMAQWAIRWILDHKEVSVVIPGASKPSQVESNMAASALKPLPWETHEKLRKFYNDDVISLVRGEI
ncbi:aldo/keto reductase [Saccharicrinis sp. FJH62]|uniref:aldo/keto reductase n=1 Tax=Saccharicrinis sp. FJH62 TaxID=3344657 RepID=UPI0035D4E81C